MTPHPESRRAARHRPGTALLGALLLGTPVLGAHAAPVALRTALSGPGAPAVRATLDLTAGGATRTVTVPEGGTLLDLPPGPVRVTLRGGGATVETQDFTVTPQGADVTVVVVPAVTVQATLPESAAPGDTVTARITLRNDYVVPLTLTPDLALAPGLMLLRAVNLTRTVAPGAAVTVDVPLLVGAAEDLGVSVNVRGLPARADAQVGGRLPARAELSVVRAGPDQGSPLVNVRNAGQVDGRFPVQMQASGVQGAHLLLDGQPLAGGTLDVPAGEHANLTVAGVPLTADAQVTVTVGGVSTRVPVPAADAPLGAALTVSPADPLPGETVTATLTVTNRTGGPVTGPLDVHAPTWLALTGPGGTVTLPDGDSELTWTGTVPFGPAARADVSVRGSGPLAAVQGTQTVTRTLLTVRTGEDPEPAVAGSVGLLPIFVRNPVNRAVTVTVRPDTARGADSGPPAVLDLESYGAVVSNISVQGDVAGTTSVTVTPLVEGVPAGVPQAGHVTFTPALQAERRSTLAVPFAVQGLTTGTVLAAHLPPEGTRVVPGSAAVLAPGGRVTLPDPLVGPDGRLYWSLPAGVYGGTLQYDVAHAGTLDAPAPLALTARVGDRDILLAGALSSADLARATPLRGAERDSLIRFPRDGVVLPEGGRTDVILEGPADVPVRVTVNGVEVPEERVGEAGRTFDRERLVYVGLPMQVGANVIEVQYGALSDRVQVFVPGAATRLNVTLEDGAVADGARPVVLLVRSLDAQDLPSGLGQATVSTTLEPLDPDADPATPGYQVNLQGGVARVRLEAVTSAQTLEADAMLGELRTRAALFIPVPQQVTASYQVSAGATYSARAGLRSTLVARGYGEFPLGGGQMQVAADTEQLPALTSAGTPQRRYPLTGSGSEARTALSSDVGLAFRYERRELSVGYYDGPLNVPAQSGLPNASALRVTANDGPVTLHAVAARLPGGTVTDTFVPDGGRQFTLSVPAAPSTERVVLRGTAEQVLVAGRDYTLDAVTGTLTLARTPSLFGADFEKQTLVVTYAPAGEQRTQLGAAVGASYRQGPWSLGASVGAVGDTLAYGVQGRYQRPGVEVTAAYQRGPDSPDGRVSVNGTFQAGRVSGSVNAGGTGDLSRTLTGTAEVAYRPGPFGVRLSGRVLGPQVWTAVQGEWRTPAGVTVSAGPEVRWATGTQGVALNALVGGSVTRGNVTAELTHAQPVVGGDDPLTRFGVSYALSATTTLQGRVQRSGPQGLLSGELGVQQKLGTSNLNVTYQLPGASGQGSRARFGVSAPVVLSKTVSATVNASVLRDLDRGLNTVGAGFTVNYRRDALAGSLGADYTGSVDGHRLGVRGGVTGSVGAHVLSVDGTLQVRPGLGGQVNASHSWRSDRVALLQYHRFNSLETDPTVEGEVALDVVFPPAPGRMGLNLQPSVAYQVPLTRRGDVTVQASLGVSVPVTDRFGVGVNAYVIAQPGSGQSAGTLGADLRYRVRDDLRLVAGYTMNVAGPQLTGLTPGAGGGIFVRADLFGGR